MRKALALLLAAALLVTPALAVQEEPAATLEAQPLSPWAYDALADIYALGMWSDDYDYCILDPVTEEQLELICGAVAEKLALLSIAPNEDDSEPLVIDNTRRGVKNALYQEIAAYDMPYVDSKSVYDTLGELGVVLGDGTGNDIDSRVCTLQEALVMASRLVLSLYDCYNAGSLGLLWKAVNGGNTLYLLGTIHVDRSNVYPLHRQLRTILTEADAVLFEVDLNDAEGMTALMLMQMYRDGSLLSDHIAPALYGKVVQALAPLGLSEQQVAVYKPWALANTFQALAMMDESTGETFMAVDSYVNAKAANVGVTIGAVESYEFQGGIFDSLSDAYQEEYLSGTLELYLGADAENQTDSGDLDDLDAWMEAWKTRDITAFAASYDKDAYLTGDDELACKLFTERDPHMIAAAAEILAGDTRKPSSADPHKTIVMVVGAGHMIGETGIVQGLIDLGYAVEEVKLP